MIPFPRTDERDVFPSVAGWDVVIVGPMHRQDGNVRKIRGVKVIVVWRKRREEETGEGGISEVVRCTVPLTRHDHRYAQLMKWHVVLDLEPTRRRDDSLVSFLMRTKLTTNDPFRIPRG